MSRELPEFSSDFPNTTDIANISIAVGDGATDYGDGGFNYRDIDIDEGDVSESPRRVVFSRGRTDSETPSTLDPDIFRFLSSTEAPTTTEASPYTANTTSAQQTEFSQGQGTLTQRELTILLATLIPAIVIIIILTTKLIYLVNQRKKRSRVGMHIEHKHISENGNPPSDDRNGRAAQVRSSNSSETSGRNCNGASRPTARAWEDNEVSNRREANH